MPTYKYNIYKCAWCTLQGQTPYAYIQVQHLQAFVHGVPYKGRHHMPTYKYNIYKLLDLQWNAYQILLMFIQYS
jgi:hypothetical protein